MARSLKDLDAAFLGKQKSEDIAKAEPIHQTEPIPKVEIKAEPTHKIEREEVKQQEQRVEKKTLNEEKIQDQSITKEVLNKEKPQVQKRIQEELKKLLAIFEKAKEKSTDDEKVDGKSKRNKWQIISDVIFYAILITIGLVAIVLSNGSVEGQAGKMYDIFIIHGGKIITSFIILMVVSFAMRIFGEVSQERLANANSKGTTSKNEQKQEKINDGTKDM